MSLKEAAIKAVDGVVHEYIKNIAQKYNLDPLELLKLWDASHQENSTTEEVPEEKHLLTLLKPELVLLCKKNMLPCKGTKTDLIKILLQAQKSQSPGKQTPAPPENSKTTKGVPAKSILSQLQLSVPTIAIRKNQWGNHEDPQTNLVFDKVSKKVIGKQNPKGCIDELTKDDIIMCQKNKYNFILPENLDRKTSLDDEKIEELDDDEELIEEDDEDIEIEDEEEEDLDEDDDPEDDVDFDEP